MNHIKLAIRVPSSNQLIWIPIISKNRKSLS